jgi:metal-responsive CopG/Arc/MetJ family transcriptional regulator
MMFRATLSESERVDAIAEREERSRSQVVRRIFRRGLSQEIKSRKARQLVGSK